MSNYYCPDCGAVASKEPCENCGGKPPLAASDCSASSREHEIHALRTKLYNAACEYARCVNDPKHTMEEAMRLSDELEATAEAWAFR